MRQCLSFGRDRVPAGAKGLNHPPEQDDAHLTLTLARFANHDEEPDWRRIGLPVETRTYEVVKPPDATQRLAWTDLEFLVTTLAPAEQQEPLAQYTIGYEQWDWRKQWNPQAEPDGLINGVPANTRLRLIEHVRTVYRKNDLTGSLALGEVESLALPGDTYKLSLTPALLAGAFKRQRAGHPDEDLLPQPPQLAPLLEGIGDDQGGYVTMDGGWWIPSGRIFYDPDANIKDPASTAAQERQTARDHFFLPRKFADPFGYCTTVDYSHDLLVARTEDALHNTITATNDCRVLQPWLVTDPNGNRTQVAFDALGMVVGTAVMGKTTEQLGDLLDASFEPDLAEDQLDALMSAPRVKTANPDESAAGQIAYDLLGKATTRIVYDLGRFKRLGEPPFAATLARETHVEPAAGQRTKIQVSFSYSDGYGREIQKKIQAEPGPVPQHDSQGKIVIKPDGQPQMTADTFSPRWVGSGWTIFNNKGKPVRQYEPFFTDTHRFEFEVKIGVSPVLFYDPVERVVATLHPNHTYEKVVFDPWQQVTWDANDTVLRDPRTDDDIEGYTASYFAGLSPSPPAPPWQTWYMERQAGALGSVEQAAATKAAAHADTPTTAQFDTLGRSFLTTAHNRVVCPGHPLDGREDKWDTRIELDIEGNQRAVKDAKGRVVMRYDYDMLGNRIHQASMEAGERWTLNDVTGKPIRAWDSRRFLRRMTYDELRRPVGLYVTENGTTRLAEQTIYGESQGDAGNHRTRMWRVKDGAGWVTNVAYDFKGNLLESRRDLWADYKKAADWQQNLTPNYASFNTYTTYDALNRPTSVTTPDGRIYRPSYSEANLLDKIEVDLRGMQG